MSSEEETTSPNTDNLHVAAFVIQHHMRAYRRLRHTARMISAIGHQRDKYGCLAPYGGKRERFHRWAMVHRVRAAQ